MKNKILKYSQISNKLTKKDLNIYHKSNNTLLLDKKHYSNFIGFYDIKNLKTLIIQDTDINYNYWIISNVTANDIYFSSLSNLGGLTISFDYIISNKCELSFNWENTTSNFDKINIVFKDKVLEIPSKQNIEILIQTIKEKLFIEIRNCKTKLTYLIDSHGNKEIIKSRYIVAKEDVINGELDLRNYIDYPEVYFDNIKIEKLIINKEIINNKQIYHDLFGRVNFDILQIIDDTEMKLIPKSYEIKKEKDNEINILTHKIFNNYIYFEGDNSKIIYTDKKNELKYIEQKMLEDNDSVEKVDFILERTMNNNNSIPLILIKYKNNKLKALIFDKSYEITNLFKKFVFLNKNKYIDVKDEKYLVEDNYFKIINTWGRKFFSIYSDYLVFKERINKLLSLGFSYKALIYLYDRKINGLINTLNKDIIEYDKIEDYEIEHYNEIGKKYIKTLRKSGGVKNEND